MAVLRQGSVISATVEQSLGNCLLISFKHRSRTFRGVLFDERNSVVLRATANKQNDDHNLMVNKSSLPLGTAIVSPCKQPYSSLRNRIYFNTNAKRSGSSNSRSNSSRTAEGKSNFGGNTQNGETSLGSESNVNCSSLPGQTKMGTEQESGLELRQSSRLLRQKSKSPTEIGNALKRKADSELVGSKPVKSRSNVQVSNAVVVSTRNETKTQKKASSDKSSNSKVETNSSDVDKNEVRSEKHEKFESDKVDVLPNTSINEDGSDHECSTPNSIKQNIFPPDHSSNDSSVFNNDQTDNQSISNEDNKSVCDENDGVTEFFGSLGLGRTRSVDKDDASIFTDSGTSSSASEHFFERQDECKDDLYHDNELENNTDLIMKEDTGNKITPDYTPTKKSARISAKRAVLEQNIASCNDENTIWSIWGGSPIKHQNKINNSSSEDGQQEIQTNSDCANMSPDSLSSSELSLEPVKDTTEATINKVKGPRIKQTPVRVKKVASPAVQPEKQVSVGNIVWGKVHGHPWWPGRVLAVSGNIGEGNEVTQHAHITWFGSNTSSIMPVNELQHFLANFARRHKKAKRGCYRKAVKQAQDMLAIMGEITQQKQ